MKTTTGRARALLDKTVPVEQGDPHRLTWFGRQAAIPARSIVEAGAEIRLEVRAPGATARSTEARWEPTSQRLLLGVWCGKPPRELELPLKFPVPELSWFASFHLPGCAGELARVSVAHGLITIRVPKTAPVQLTALTGGQATSPAARQARTREASGARSEISNACAA